MRLPSELFNDATASLSSPYNGIPPVFYNCPYYRESDGDKYNDCELLSGQNRCEMLRANQVSKNSFWELHEAKDFRKYWFVIFPLICSLMSFAVNGIFVYLTVFRNQYGFYHTLLLNRTVCTLMALTLFYIVLVFWRFNFITNMTAAVFIGVGMLTFFNYTATYVAITLSMYYAVLNPFFYREYFTTAKCLMVISLIWAFSFGGAIFVGILGSSLFYPDTTPFCCDFATCQWRISLGLVVFVVGSYFFVIGFYAILVLTARERARRRCGLIDGSFQQKSAKSLSVASMATNNKQQSADGGGSETRIRESNIRTMNRLSFNLFTFAVFKAPIVACSVIALLHLERLRALGIGQKTSCKTFMHGRLFLQVEILASIAANVWLIGILIDPLLNIFLNEQYRCALLGEWRRVRGSLQWNRLSRQTVNKNESVKR